MGLKAGIAGIGVCLPDRVLTNDELATMVDTSDTWIRERVGVLERRIADKAQAASDLGTVAAARALETAGVAAEEVDLVIVATATPDMLFPATACIIQENLGLKNSAAFDLAAGCSGFIYALATGSQFIESGVYRTVLVIGTETLSKITDWTDRETCILLADGAGAVVLRPAQPGYGILAVKLGADGLGGKHLRRPAGGSRQPHTPQTLAAKLDKLQMNGQEVFRFAIKALPEATLEALAVAGLDKDDVALVVPHQANRRIIEAAARRLELPMERFMINLDRYGNTSSASVPIALHEALKNDRLKDGDIVALTAFGAGLTWGSAVLRWHSLARRIT
ncbi:beta-ketoacyl-ACP synthase III [Anaeroselena agilis]|uniref:Beta-ketoacyl-[acyl-carrier-protein] synthase III n=1 Tax=Anaeroselena agilis TaxID=3063788 RepID=A0ABU3P3J9_9FIRM|nr:beta-ketoacyl-ACP synthase III [Selenomonadales bacterium 4137-cl]